MIKKVRKGHYVYGHDLMYGWSKKIYFSHTEALHALWNNHPNIKKGVVGKVEYPKAADVLPAIDDVIFLLQEKALENFGVTGYLEDVTEEQKFNLKCEVYKAVIEWLKLIGKEPASCGLKKISVVDEVVKEKLDKLFSTDKF